MYVFLQHVFVTGTSVCVYVHACVRGFVFMQVYVCCLCVVCASASAFICVYIYLNIYICVCARVRACVCVCCKYLVFVSSFHRFSENLFVYNHSQSDNRNPC